MFLAVSAVFAQGGAGGFGQGSAAGYGQDGQLGPGGGQGGFGGRGNMGNFDSNFGEKPEADETQGVWETRSAILTPGDRVEYKFKMAEGETIFAAASSDAFDPALSFVDEKGVELMKNDDRAEGEQDPFLIFRAPSAGTYALRVLSYRSVSGGKFSLKFRTFKAEDAGFESKIHSGMKPTSRERGDHFFFRIKAVKDRFYDLGTLYSGKNHNPTWFQVARVVGPTGVAANDLDRLPTVDGTFVFQAKATGDFYLEYRLPGGNDIGTEFRELSAVSMNVKDEKSFELEPRELKIIEVAVKPDWLMHTICSGSSFTYFLAAPGGQSESPNYAQRGYDSSPFVTRYKVNVDSDNDVVRVFHTEGMARIVVRSTATTKGKVTIRNEDTLPNWEAGHALKGSIDIGDSRLYFLHCNKSELMQVAAEASHFQLRLEIFRLSGVLANTLMKRRSHTVGDNLYFPDAGVFIVRISCDGDGGSGDFTINRDVIASTPYKLGTAQTLKLSGDDFGLYSFDLVAGKRYELLNDHSDSYLRADLLDDDGQFLVSNGVSFDKVDVQYFVPTRSGRHRLWLRGGAGSHKFQFQLNVPPALGK